MCNCVFLSCIQEQEGLQWNTLCNGNLTSAQKCFFRLESQSFCMLLQWLFGCFKFRILPIRSIRHTAFQALLCHPLEFMRSTSSGKLLATLSRFDRLHWTGQILFSSRRSFNASWKTMISKLVQCKFAWSFWLKLWCFFLNPQFSPQPGQQFYSFPSTFRA